MTTPYTPPSIGDIVYLASALIRVRVGAISTDPSTPNQYTAELKVMGDQGDMNLDAIRGPTGPAGQQTFAFRRQDDADVNTPEDLPTNLTDSPDDIGKYWLIDTVDQGVVTMETAWTWYGTTEKWQQFMMGTFGPPGPVPDITVGVNTIDPHADAYVDGGGSTLQPTWELYLPEPYGPPGPIGPLALFPDVDVQTNPPKQYDLLSFQGKYNSLGNPIFANESVADLRLGPYSMPENAFTAFSGLGQQVPIGSYTIPAQPFPWTPVVWGHIGGTKPGAVGVVNAIQHILVSAIGGYFTLNIPVIPGLPGTATTAATAPTPASNPITDFVTTAAIAWNAIPSDIENAINAVIGAGNSIVQQGIQDFSHLIEFIGGLAGQAIGAITANVGNLIPPGIANVLTGNVQTGGATQITSLATLLTGDPFKIGVQVLLNDPKTGIEIARGIGNTVGTVTVSPHYSVVTNKNQTITPKNQYAMVPANQSATIYVNLWNDGLYGVYAFEPTNAQMFIMALPTDLGPGGAAGAGGTRRRGITR